MSSHTSFEKMVQDCQAAITRIRQAMIDGNEHTPEQGKDWELIHRSLRQYLTPIATKADKGMPGAGEELQQLAYDRINDHIRSLTYHSLARQFGSYLKDAKQRSLGIIQQRTCRIARLDAARHERSCLADHMSDPQAELAFDSVVNRLMLESALAQLSHDDRKMFTLIKDGYSCLEIARLLGVDESTIARRRDRAGKRLRDILGDPDS